MGLEGIGGLGGPTFREESLRSLVRRGGMGTF